VSRRSARERLPQPSARTPRAPRTLRPSRRLDRTPPISRNYCKTRRPGGALGRIDDSSLRRTCGSPTRGGQRRSHMLAEPCPVSGSVCGVLPPRSSAIPCHPGQLAPAAGKAEKESDTQQDVNGRAETRRSQLAPELIPHAVRRAHAQREQHQGRSSSRRRRPLRVVVEGDDRARVLHGDAGDLRPSSITAVQYRRWAQAAAGSLAPRRSPRAAASTREAPPRAPAPQTRPAPSPLVLDQVEDARHPRAQLLRSLHRIVLLAAAAQRENPLRERGRYCSSATSAGPTPVRARPARAAI